VKNLNSVDSEFERVYYDTTGEAQEELILDLPQPTIARVHKIEIKLKLQMVNLEKKISFNLTDDGAFILLDGSQGLRFKQRFDKNFGKEYQLTKQSFQETSISANSKNFKKTAQSAGFEINQETGQKDFGKIVENEGQVRTMKTEAKKKDTTIEDLEKLASLRDAGILTEEEFQAKKKIVLGI